MTRHLTPLQRITFIAALAVVGWAMCGQTAIDYFAIRAIVQRAFH